MTLHGRVRFPPVERLLHFVRKGSLGATLIGSAAMKLPISVWFVWIAVAAVLGIAFAQLGVLGWFRHGLPPRIHDLTTDLDDPPSFRPAEDDAGKSRRHRPYPHGGDAVRELQRTAYRDLSPIQTPLGKTAAFERALVTARAMGWAIVWSDPEQGLIEATATSRWFRFVDDIVIRVRPLDAGSVVDLRSISRVGVGDLGANAARIRRFTGRFQNR